MCSIFFAQAQSITISEINYKSDVSNDAGDWFEIHNFGTTAVNIGGWRVLDSTKVGFFTFPTGTTILPGGYLAVVRDAAKFTAKYASVTNYIGAFGFKLNSFDSLILEDGSQNVIVKAVINSNKYWPDGADGEGRTMQLINENSNTGLTSTTAWRDGCMLGSPGAAPQTTCNDPIIFSEINYNSDSVRDMGEFIELYNNTSAPINLTGYFMRDGLDTITNIYNFPAGTIIPSNGFLVVSNDTARLRKFKGNKANFLGNFDFNLNNGGELLRLYNPNGILQFSIHYRDTIPWTDSADGKGYTLEIKDYKGRTNDGKNYFAGCPGGSPGEVYTPTCKPFWPLSINNIDIESQILVYPILAKEIITIEQPTVYYNWAYIIDGTGKIIKKVKLDNTVSIVDINFLNKGVYLIKMTTKNGTKGLVKKFVKLD